VVERKSIGAAMAFVREGDAKRTGWIGALGCAGAVLRDPNCWHGVGQGQRHMAASIERRAIDVFWK
jgi:hypothetical protein